MKHNLCVAITCFNEKELLTECLKSLLNQTEMPDEILVYDDASQFPAKDYIPKGSPIKLIRDEINRGVGYARNVLLSTCQSDYIHIHDGDDLFYPDWCAKVKEAINTTEPDIVITEVASLKNGRIIREDMLGLKRLLEIKDLVRFTLMACIYTLGATYRRDITLKIGGFRTRELFEFGSDTYFNVRFAAMGDKYTVIFEPLVIKNCRPDCVSHQNFQGCLEDWLKSIRFLSEELPLQYKQDLVEAAVRLGSSFFRLGAISKAREAFRLARSLGKPAFIEQNRLYRFVARVFGPEIAERLGFFYRHLVFERLRRILAGRNKWYQ